MQNSFDLICTSVGLLFRRVGLHEIIHVELLHDWCAGLWMFLFVVICTLLQNKDRTRRWACDSKNQPIAFEDFFTATLCPQKNGDSPGLVVGCQFEWTLPRCQLWLPLRTLWSGEECHAGCRLDPALSAIHHWVRIPYIWMQRLWLCGFCLVSVCWSLGEGRVQERLSGAGVCSCNVVFIQIFFDCFLVSVSQVCVPLQPLLQSVPLNFGHEVVVR